MYYLNAADFREEEDYDGFYDASEKQMIIHSDSEAMTMTAAKLTPKGLTKFGGPKIDINDLASNNTINNFTAWTRHPERLQIPSRFHFKNKKFCESKEFTLLAAVYDGYGKMGPLRRNPQSIRAKEIKLDSKAISVQIMVSPDPAKPEQDLSSCTLGN